MNWQETLDKIEETNKKYNFSWDDYIRFSEKKVGK